MLIAAILAAVSVVLPADLAKAAHDYDQAQTTSNRAELERLLADDYVLHNSGGQAQDKTSFIADQIAPGYKLEPFEVTQKVEKVMGDAAILGGVARARGTSGGEAYDVTLRFVDVWAKRGGKWVVVMSQATRVPKG
ncbi:MAG: nuclear transport factor 2 family protein [Alphaproteobacteria bacterium]|nr:nuclear transport factor 2 family protein [Alphaproteobacteria bacterium]MBU1514657.1 nuclear transport factor 2 family protein [Alphaproteobacteria bacterium]MBU2096711.1 nuclear transport factor 2 family protein [Alphaproteobacteria bacterium]MBU2150343.1 nuclear transport factor 2 family protein [Alphaproteobacteria bacterium]MBU2306656.1 nuclear transport factor 2 family protein [Alphaproteobacteria bacterium]